ncbi:MAG TPA: sulfide/dihydroorotate dehydrogenase-like FAD/NAD-binding protein [Candidatus Aerophobetes bacterium]|uniref:Sulfide/dihydroorotate dehydrogenase-like FAD/NAD-binding protein n=2 Tax=Aerophobetes bacterium TaxID=2030807 RepID=A0A7V0MZV8_UNCAE|nr:sulfide/dihydroorotate dehydrogenase-like FAD/NAD-binding protein [Candidatus Aerophobetes bacterium]
MQTKNFAILEKRTLASRIVLFRIKAPLIARKCQPGQFVILRLNEKGERIPLTISEYNREEGTITIVVQDAGRTTHELSLMEKGETIEDILGPLGRPTDIKKVGTVVGVGGGVGVALLYPEIKAYKEVGNRVISLIGAQNKDLLFFQDKIEAVSDKVIYSTDDGSFGYHGFVTELLKEILEKGEEKISEVIAIGPIPMMRVVAEITRPYKVKTIVSLNPIMVDGTGMCGSCRVKVGGQTKFACVDGPEFDAHLVDFDGLMKRQKRFLEEEKISLQYQQRG